MGAQPLEKRLAWLENGHADDPAYWVRRVLKMRHVTIADYFLGDIRRIRELGEYLLIPVINLEQMTYEAVARKIAEMYEYEPRRVAAYGATWVLAGRYVSIWHTVRRALAAGETPRWNFAGREDVRDSLPVEKPEGRVSLEERLKLLKPKQKGDPRLLERMTLRMFINVTKYLMPKQGPVLYGLIRCGNDGMWLDLTLGEIAAKCAEVTSETTDKLMYNMLIRPFDAMAKEVKCHE